MSNTNSNRFEIAVGAAVVVFVGFLLTFVWGANSNHGNKYYAKFSRCEGINQGSEVRISGVKVGSVSQITLDAENYSAVVEMSVNNKHKIPTDSQCTINSDGLLGGKFLSIQVGSEESYLANEGLISRTSAGVSIESMINNWLFQKKKD